MNKKIAKISTVTTIISVIPTYLILLSSHTISPSLIIPFSFLFPVFFSMWVYEEFLKVLGIFLQKDLSDLKNTVTLLVLFFTTHFLYYYFVIKIIFKKKEKI